MAGKYDNKQDAKSSKQKQNEQRLLNLVPFSRIGPEVIKSGSSKKRVKYSTEQTVCTVFFIKILLFFCH